VTKNVKERLAGTLSQSKRKEEEEEEEEED